MDPTISHAHSGIFWALYIKYAQYRTLKSAMVRILFFWVAIDIRSNFPKNYVTKYFATMLPTKLMNYRNKQGCVI